MLPDKLNLAAKVEGLKKSFGDVVALNGVNFQIPQGCVTAILGPNGAGKTTAIRILAGSLLADAGRAEVGGICVADYPLEAKKQIGYLPENNPLWQDMTVEETLAFAWVAQGEVGSKAAQLERVVNQTGLSSVFRRRVRECSKGYRQRVGLAQALVSNPSLLILDEPTNGLDPIQVVEIRQLIRTLGREKTVILTTHVLSEVEVLADRVILLHQGLKNAEGSLQEVTQSNDGNVFRVCISGTSANLKSLAEKSGAIWIESQPTSSPEIAAGLMRIESGDLIAKAASELDFPLLELTPRTGNLEALFYRLQDGGLPS